MATARRRLVIVSNRGPVLYERVGGRRSARRGGGGLVTALSGLIASHDVTWIAVALSDEDGVVANEHGDAAADETDRAGNPFRLRLVEIERADYDRYYNVFANPLLWFLQHGLWNRPYTPEMTAATRAAWESYRRVNEVIATAAAAAAGEGCDAVLVHDYQLYLVPRMLRDQGLRAPLAHFTHIPWPGPDAWRVLTADMRLGLLRGLLGADVIGFQTARSVRAFLATAEEFLPEAFVDHVRPRVTLRDEAAHVRSYPISIDPAAFALLAAHPTVTAAEDRLKADLPERLVLRVDRTDPSKNVVRGFRAFARFLARHPEWHGRVRMLALLDPSRLEIPEYAEYVGAIQRAAREVNDQFADPGWTPIDLRMSNDFALALAAYKHYDVLLVNAIVDGMNLIAKEAPLVNERDGVLVLSENTGAHEELGGHALSINPFDLEGTADAIAAALAMPVDERRRRADAIRSHVRAHDVRAWIAAQLSDLDSIVDRGAR
jgi:trehalose 6-phosphate synthase